MAEGRGEIELYNQWFQLADTDRDGVLSGGEAVQFFLRSGLPQNPTLFKVWQYVAGDRPALSRQEFYTAMKLVSLAQANGGVLDDQQAMKLINGLAGPMPPPQMMGLASAAPPPAFTAPAIPSRPSPAPPAAFGAAPAFPPLTPDKAAIYQTAFDQLDGDRDGVVTGGDCFVAFMRSGLPKAVLKDVWDVVAGDASQLNRHQFVQCMYLIDCAKAGITVPAVLPPGQFPPVHAGIGLNSMVAQGGQDIYSQMHVAPLPQRAVYTPGAAPAVAFQSQVPPAPAAAQLAGLAPAEIGRLQSEREAALHQEAERQRAEEERVAIAARREFYTQSLADLRVAQSKVARTLVEAQQRCEMEKAEAERMEAQYNAAYEGFSAEHARVGPMLETLKGIEEEKAGLAAKMAALQAMVAQLEDYDPEWETREKGECERMRQEITELTVKHETLQRSTAAIEAQRDTMQSAIAALQAASEHVAGGIDALEAEVKGLSDEAKANGATVVAFLQRLAPLYNELYAAAKAAMVPLPKEALASIVRPAPTAFKYDPLRFGGAAGDWETFTDEGFVIAATIPPDPRLASLTSPALAAAEAEVAEGKAGDAATDDPVEGEGDGVQEDAAGEADSIAPVADENGGEEEKAEGVVEGNGGETAAAAEPEGDAAALPIPAEDTADPPAAADASVEDQKDVAEVVEGPEAAEEVADGKLQEEAPQVEVVVTPEVAPEPEDPLAALVLEAAKTRVLKPAAP